MDTAGINFIDTYQRSGLYKVPLPFILGREGAGSVAEVGPNVTTYKVGDRVCFFAQGAYAKFVAVGVGALVKIPDNITYEQAAASLLQGLTAHYLTHSTYAIKKGDFILVHAGAGGTGRLIIQMAKMRGATVITTVSNAEKAAIAKEAGADHIINYSVDDFQTKVHEITAGKGCACVYDGVGLSTWEKSLKCVAKCGMLVLFGNSSGAVPPIDPLLLMTSGSVSMCRPTLADYLAGPGVKQGRVDDLFNGIASGQVTLLVAKTFPLDEAAYVPSFFFSFD